MSKPKTFLKQGKVKKKKEQFLETADDFQAAGVEFEDAAGKWRAGDAVKSLRFFGRAVEVYDQGLQKFPRSLDLAYNKARVQLEIATHPILVQQLQNPILNALEAALSSHQYALSLDPQNADTLFNTSQVLTAIAEEYAKDANRTDQEALQILEEALNLQNQCLSVQELKYEEGLEQQAALAQQANSTNEADLTTETQDASQPSENDEISSAAEDQWFSVVEPITKDTLIDTTLAQLATLTTLCSILSSATASAPTSTLVWVEEYSNNLLNVKLPQYATDSDPERLQEIAQAKAIFISALLEAGFRRGKIDVETYERERENAFSIPELQLEKSADALLANAQSLMAYSSALAETESPEPSSYASMQWSALMYAIASLTKASKTQSILPPEIAKTQLLRGDCSLLQLQLSFPPISFPTALSNQTLLLKNAEVFYRNASKLSQDNEQKDMGSFREAVVRGIGEWLNKGRQDSERVGTKVELEHCLELALMPLQQMKGQDWLRNQLTDMDDDGLLPSGPA